MRTGRYYGNVRGGWGLTKLKLLFGRRTSNCSRGLDPFLLTTSQASGRLRNFRVDPRHSVDGSPLAHREKQLRWSDFNSRMNPTELPAQS